MSIVKEVLYNDGEYIDFNDANAAQRYLRSIAADIGLAPATRVTDNLLGVGGFTHADQVIFPSLNYAYSRYASGAPRPGGSARQITNLEGPLMQYTLGTGPDGTNPALLTYWAAADELLTTLDIGDADPRIDLICIKIDHVNGDSQTRDFKDATTGVISSQTFNKQRQTRLQVAVAKGTPAGSPTYPAPPAGYVPWCSVFVPAGYNSTYVTTTHLRDFRVPLGWKTRRVYAHEVADGTGWTKNGGASGIRSISAGSGNRIVFPLDFNIYNERLISVSLSGQLNSGATINLNRRQYGFTAADTSGALELLKDLSSIASGSPSLLQGYPTYFITPDLPTYGIEPIWGSGRKVPILNDDMVAANIERTTGIEIEIFASSAVTHPDTMFFVEFETAGGW